MTPDRPPRSILVIATPECAAFIAVMLRDIANALAETGEDVHLRLMMKDDDAEPILAKARELAAAGRDVYQVDINATFNVAPSEHYPMRHRFALLVDHPLHHLHRILPCRMPHGGIPMTVGVVDSTHLPALRDFGIDLPVRLMPHGGPEIAEPLRPMAERDIDVLYCANLSPLVFEDEVNRELRDLPDDRARGIVIAAINRVLGGEPDIHAALKATFGRGGPTPFAGFPPPVLAQMFHLVEGVTVAMQRRDLIAALCRIPERRVDIVGNMPDILRVGSLNPQPNVRFHGRLSFDWVIKLMDRTRILVNANPSISGGSHERIWQAMSRGCAVMTNHSSFMEESFADGRDLLYQPPEAAAVTELLYHVSGEPGTLEAMTARAREIYQANHRWSSRVRVITDVFDAEGSGR